MKQYGMVKTMCDAAGEERKLIANAYTYVVYKNYFGRDLLSDIIDYARKATSQETVEVMERLGIKAGTKIEDLSVEQQSEIITTLNSSAFDSEFLLNFLAALMATGMYPDKPDIVEVISSIPTDWITDQSLISEITEMLSMFIKQRKN